MKIFKKAYIKGLWKIVVATFTGFINDNGLKLSASLAYYTIFSIAPLLILVMSLAGIFLGGNAEVMRTIIPHIAQIVGKPAARQIQIILINLRLSGKSGTAVVIGIITLLLGASSMFIEIQDSLNIIWRVKAKPKRGWVKLLVNRFLSFSLIIVLGFLLLVSLIIDLLLLTLSEKLQYFLPGITLTLLNVVNAAVTFIVIAILFGIMFKFLPDVKIKWKDVRAGAFFTALLFLLGKYLISLYIQHFANSSVYGAAGSVILVLLWIYYTATILYIGAEFTQVYAEAIGSSIEPAEYAVLVKQTEIEKIVHTMPLQNPELKNRLKPSVPDKL